MFKYEKIEIYTLNEWVQEFDEIYGRVNEKRSPADIWLHVVEHAASIHEDLRISDYAGAFNHLPRLFCWVCGFVKRASMPDPFATNPSFQDIVLNKFPRQCFYCGEKRCNCQSAFGAGIQNLDDKKRLKQERRDRARMAKEALLKSRTEPRTLQEFAEMFRDVFGHKNYDSTMGTIAAHLQEEIGEVAEDINEMVDERLFGTGAHRTRLDLEEEIADSLAWIMAVYWKIDLIVGAAQRYFGGEATLNISLAEHIWKVFSDPTGTHLVDPATKKRVVIPIS